MLELYFELIALIAPPAICAGGVAAFIWPSLGKPWLFLVSSTLSLYLLYMLTLHFTAPRSGIYFLAILIFSVLAFPLLWFFVKLFRNQLRVDADLSTTTTQTNDTPSIVVRIIVFLSLLCLGAGLVLGVSTIISAVQGVPFLRVVDYAYGLAIIGVGILLSCLLNMICWGLRYWPRWLRVMMAFQVLFIMINVLCFLCFLFLWVVYK